MEGNPKPKNQWKKGQSGNPKGRPKQKESIRYWLRDAAGIKYKDFPVKVNKELLNVYTEEELQEKTLAEIMSLSRWVKALEKGEDETMIQEIDGRLKEHIVTESISGNLPDQEEQQDIKDRFAIKNDTEDKEVSESIN